MDESDIEIAKRGYAVWNEVYRTGDVELVRPFLEEHWAADAVFVPAGILPESQPVHGVEGLMRFTLEQMKAFADGSMWIWMLTRGGARKASQKDFCPGTSKSSL